MGAEFAGEGKIRLTITGHEAAAAGQIATVTVSADTALRLAGEIQKTAELMRRMDALVKAEKAAGYT